MCAHNSTGNGKIPLFSNSSRSACRRAALCVYRHAITNVVSVVSISLGQAGGAVLTGCLSSKEMSDKDSRRLNPPSLLPLHLAVPHQHARGQDA